MLGKFSEENTLSTNGNFMVSIQLDIIKFLLIYRHLQNDYWFKRGNLSVYSLWGIAKHLVTNKQSPHAKPVYITELYIWQAWAFVPFIPVTQKLAIFKARIKLNASLTCISDKKSLLQFRHHKVRNYLRFNKRSCELANNFF